MADKVIRNYDAGQIVFKEGDRGGVMYILLEGCIELKKRVGDGEQLLKRVEKRNEFFGEMALIDEQPRSANAVALTPSRLLEVNHRAFERLILNNGRFALTIIRTLSARIRNSNAQISELIELLPHERFVRGMVDYALQHGERIYNGGLKVNTGELGSWINQYLGFSQKEIDHHLHRLIRTNQTPYASTAQRSKDHIVLSEKFVAQHDRRKSAMLRYTAQQGNS